MHLTQEPIRISQAFVKKFTSEVYATLLNVGKISRMMVPIIKISFRYNVFIDFPYLDGGLSVSVLCLCKYLSFILEGHVPCFVMLSTTKHLSTYNYLHASCIRNVLVGTVSCKVDRITH